MFDLFHSIILDLFFNFESVNGRAKYKYSCLCETGSIHAVRSSTATKTSSSHIPPGCRRLCLEGNSCDKRGTNQHVTRGKAAGLPGLEKSSRPTLSGPWSCYGGLSAVSFMLLCRFEVIVGLKGIEPLFVCPE